MKKCKVRGCKEKHHAKGYCAFHYGRLRTNIPFTIKCKFCKKIITERHKRKFCSKKCYYRYDYLRDRGKMSKYIKENFVNIPFFIKRKGNIRKVFTNGFTGDLKPLIQKIKDDVLNDAIKNPRKYLR